MISYLSKFTFGLLAITIPGTISVYCQVKSAAPNQFCEKEIVSWDYSSKVVGEDYTIYIHFPPGYDTTKTKYPVLYMTDGDWNMTVAMNCFNMLRQDYETTEPLIVGIGYGTRPNKRGRDLDPGTGGPKFLDFIEQEVMPFVQSKYRVSNNKALYGYSLGGMLTTFVLFEHPDLFNMIFIGAPGNGGNELIPAAQKYFTTHKDLNCKVFAGVGSFEHTVVSNITQFKAYMEKQNCKNLEIATAITPNAGHGAALAQVMQNAIAFAYCKKHKPITLTVADLEKYTGGYTIAGDTKNKFKLYVDNKMLYFKQNEEFPIQLVPYNKDGFFMYENEKGDISFKEEGSRKYILFAFPNEKPTRLDKIN